MSRNLPLIKYQTINRVVYILGNTKKCLPVQIVCSLHGSCTRNEYGYEWSPK